ncbi:queuine tRNA-ribosyltransferase [Priestia megaterium]|uniref:queuine tRNA-ribosyltransferase n=1 Tax=Priestia megaterium TaxID=1404 RepID=UPI002DB65E61|nr:queuine tRNA-ribosyltransferase [Priestia megaterium]MEC1071405.1 queuine tRNA-ribosyltransferase [Priestia megaterium]
MDFYISWSHSDAIFSHYFEDCPMLISAAPKNKHAFKRVDKYPNKLIIDSGALYYSKQKRNYNVKKIMDNQLSIIDSLPEDLPIKVVHLDEPLINKNSLSEKYESVERTLFNAYEHLRLFDMIKIPKNVSMIGVIQGYDFPSIQYSIHELKKMGYTHFGLGSLLNKSAKEQINYIRYASDIVGSENLHVFGVTGIEQIREMAKLKISSFDSSRPTMAAVFFQIMYSNPFRTYVISTSSVDRSQIRIVEPLDCECPVCLENPQDLLNMSHRKYTQKRSVHNYYHLLNTIHKIKLEEGLTDVSLN